MTRKGKGSVQTYKIDQARNFVKSKLLSIIAPKLYTYSWEEETKNQKKVNGPSVHLEIAESDLPLKLV
jgi:hypothetical protein